jgi:DNA polymerase-3 subunit epsilon
VLRRQLTLAASLDIELPLTWCSTSARVLIKPVRSVPASAIPVRPPRVDCPWQLPLPWRVGDPLVQGHRVVVTGTTTAARSDLYARAVAAGLDATNGVSRVTALVVSNDRNARSRKLLDAAAYGTAVVDEREFERLLAGALPGVSKAALAEPVASSQAAPSSRPFAGRRVLVLGGPHDRAAQVRETVVARGGAAAVHLTVSTTDYVALDGAEQDKRWKRVQQLGLARLDPTTWERVGGSVEVADETPEPVVLPRGGATDLPAGALQWVLDVAWRDLGHEVDMVALRLDDEERVGGDDDLVF